MARADGMGIAPEWLFQTVVGLCVFIFLVFAGWVAKRFLEHRQTYMTIFQKLEERGKVKDDHEARIQVLEERSASHRARLDEQSRNHEIALTEFKEEFRRTREQIAASDQKTRDEIALIRRDFGKGFKELGDRFTDRLIEAMAHRGE